jgi:hypothetical protein
MKATYRFKVYIDYIDDYVNLHCSANSKREAITRLRKNIKETDGIAPKIKNFELVHKNPTYISLDKKYKTRSGLEVDLHNIGELKYSFPVRGSIVIKEKPSRKTEYSIWSINGEYLSCEYPHDKDLVEVK